MNLKLLACVSALALFTAGSAMAGTGNANSGSYNGKDNSSTNLSVDHNALNSNNSLTKNVTADNGNTKNIDSYNSKTISADNGNTSDSYNATATVYNISAAVSVQDMSSTVTNSGVSAHGLFAKAENRSGDANIGGAAQEQAAGVVMANANTGLAAATQQGSSIAAVGNISFH